MKKRLFLSTILVSTIIIGCGENSDLSDSNINYNQQNVFNSANTKKVNYSDYTVKAVDDFIKGARVSAPECNSSVELKPGLYDLKGCVSRPTYIVVEGGTIGNTGIVQKFPLVLNTSKVDRDNNFVVTPLTTLFVDANDSEIEQIASKLGLSKEDIFEDPSNVKDINITKINQKLNALFIKSIDSGAIANKIRFIDVVRNSLNDSVENNDINLSKLSKEVTLKSQENPKFFGLVFVSLKDRDSNILDELKRKKTNRISFLGLVFDKIIANADIEIRRVDNNKLLANIKAGNEGNWSVELNESVSNEIRSDDFILKFIAKDPDNDKIILESSVSSKTLRKYLDDNRVSTSEVPELTISNITTAENAILQKQNAFANVSTYQERKVALKVYNKDKVIKAAAVIKKVVDTNDTSILDDNDANNTIDLVLKEVNVSDDGYEVNLSSNLEEVNTTDVEENMTQNAILSTQINYVPSVDNEITLQTISDKYSNGIYYRLLAYYDENGNFIREYDKLILIPGNYQIKKCYLEDNDTGDWKNCTISSINEKSNYSNGNFNVVNGGITITYSLDNNDSIFVTKLCKPYRLYEVSRKEVNATDVISNEPEILVDSFDVVDMFRRMPSDDKNSFEKLKDRLKGKDRKEVNIEMNRYIRTHIEDIKNYFSDENSNNQCK